jgi:putative hemolysin
MLTVKSGIHKLELKNPRKHELTERLLKNEAGFITTIQAAVTFSALFVGASAARYFSDAAVSAITAAFPGFEVPYAHTAVTLCVTAVLTYLYVALGYIVPKRLVAGNSRRFAESWSYAVYFLYVVFKPAVALSTLSANAVLRLFGLDPHKKERDFTEDEIKMLLDASEESGNIDESEKEMIKNVFEFDNISVDNISIHRKDIVALPIGAGRDEIVRIVTTEKFTRIPVYEENIDDIVGILHVRDFLNYIILPENYNNDNIDLRRIMRKPFFVPISKKTDELFDEMQKSKVHFAVIVDEYGGTAGIVTMEDIIEEIMGNILDEYDEEETPEIEKLDETSFVISGTADLKTVSERLGIELPFDEYDTVSGFVIGRTGRIPDEDEKPDFDFNGASFRVIDVEDRRVGKVIVTVSGKTE